MKKEMKDNIEKEKKASLFLLKKLMIYKKFVERFLLQFVRNYLE